VAIYERRDGWEVRVYAGVDPVTGKQRRISRQVHGSRKKAEREETKLKAQVMDGRHRGARAKTLAELIDVYLEVARAERQADRPTDHPRLPGAGGGEDQAGAGQAAAAPGRSADAGSLLHGAAQERQPPQPGRAAVGEPAP
jgi:hypothetical protein